MSARSPSLNTIYTHMVAFKVTIDKSGSTLKLFLKSEALFSWMRDQFELRNRNKDAGQRYLSIVPSKTKRSTNIRWEIAFKNSPITRQSNMLNATVNTMLILSFWKSCLHNARVSACHLATAVASIFDWEKLMVHHFMCVGSTNNNSIATKVVSKTAINCGCALWYIYIEANNKPRNIFWSKLQTRKLLACGFTWFEELALWTCIYKSQIFNIWYMYIFLDIREEFAFRKSPIKW